MKFFIFIALISTQVIAAKHSKTEYSYKNCLAAREYITTTNYLRSKKEFGLSEKEIQLAADQVSKTCGDSSKNFIKILKVLTKMGIDTRTSLKHAVAISKHGNQNTMAFITIFKQTYDPSILDLDILTSLKISLKLSDNYSLNIKKTLKDFKNLVEFCLENQSMELSTKKCAVIASDVALKGQKFKKPVSKQFISLIDFIQNDKKGPALTRKDSLSLALEIISYGETSTKNFKQAFRFGISKKGLKLPVKDALKFALDLTKRSYSEI